MQITNNLRRYRTIVPIAGYYRRKMTVFDK